MVRLEYDASTGTTLRLVLRVTGPAQEHRLIALSTETVELTNKGSLPIATFVKVMLPPSRCTPYVGPAWPKAVEVSASMVPAMTYTSPEYVLLPFRRNVPEPVFSKPLPPTVARISNPGSGPPLTSNCAKPT